MPGEKTSGKPSARRHSDQEKTQAVRLVRQLRKELGTSHGTVHRVARQLGYGVESVRSWVRQADVDDGLTAGTTTDDAVALERVEALAAGQVGQGLGTLTSPLPLDETRSVTSSLL